MRCPSARRSNAKAAQRVELKTCGLTAGYPDFGDLLGIRLQEKPIAQSVFPSVRMRGRRGELHSIERGSFQSFRVNAIVTVAETTNIEFGNLCLGGGDGLTLGFWSNTANAWKQTPTSRGSMRCA
jgi:hypothetical protein